MANFGSLNHFYTSFSEFSSKDLWAMASDDDESISAIITPWYQNIVYGFTCV
jgi:hypothetical protein